MLPECFIEMGVMPGRTLLPNLVRSILANVVLVRLSLEV